MLSWKPPTSDGGKPITSYVVEVRDARRSTWAPSGKPKSTNFMVEKLIEGNEYFFRVSAVNDEGQGQPLDTTEVTKPERTICEYAERNNHFYIQ